MQTQFSGLRLKDFLTLASVAAGVASMALSLGNSVERAAGAVFLAALFDFADGVFARGLPGGADAFGRQLDSLADAVSFAAAPVVLVLAHAATPLAVLGSVFYAAAGVVRLARFNLQSEEGVFYGLPVPAAALVVVASAALASHDLGVAAMFLCGLLMVSKIKWNKISFK